MATKVCKHGNSLSIRLSSHIARTTGLAKGDMVLVRLLDSGVIAITPVLAEKIVPAGGAGENGVARAASNRVPTDAEVLAQW